MLQISEIVRKTEEMFDLFNEHFYEDELSRPAITMSPDGRRGAYKRDSIIVLERGVNRRYGRYQDKRADGNLFRQVSRNRKSPESP